MQNQIRASRRKYHIIYKTTCLITGKWYIGMHSTDDLSDGYQGSGQVLWKSIKKYGKEQHQCVVLEHCDDREALSLREEEIITKNVLNDPMCMNLRTGGTGNYPGKTHPDEVKRKIAAASAEHWKDPAFKKKTGNAISKALKNMAAQLTSEQRKATTEKGRAALAKRVAGDPSLREEMRTRGKAASEKLWADPEHRAKMSMAMKLRHADPVYRADQTIKTESRRFAREQDPIYQAEKVRKKREQADRLNAKRRLERSTRVSS